MPSHQLIPQIIKPTVSAISHSCRGHANGIAAALQLPPGSGPGRTAVRGDSADPDLRVEEEKCVTAASRGGGKRTHLAQLGLQLDRAHACLLTPSPVTPAHTHPLTHTRSHTETYMSSGLNRLYLHFVICGTPGSFQRLDFASCEI